MVSGATAFLTTEGEDELWSTCRFTIPPSPFPSLVAPRKRQRETRSEVKSFSRLLELPLEVLGTVFQFCDPGTLFQFMRTSRLLRSLTSNLFWTHPSIWYQVPLGWRGAEKDDPTSFGVLYAPFLQHLVQIEIDIGSADTVFRRYGPIEGTRLAKKEAEEFWQDVRLLFPSIQKVVLGAFPWRMTRVTLEGISKRNVLRLLKNTPPGIEAILSFNRGRFYQRSNTWKLDTSQATVQLQRAELWMPRRVELPKLCPGRKGALGDYQKMCRAENMCNLERRGLEMLTEETHVRYATRRLLVFGNKDSKACCTSRVCLERGIKCPKEQCGKVLHDRTGWIEHIQLHPRYPDKSCRQVAEETYAKDTPHHIIDVLKARERRIFELNARYEQLWLKVRLQMGEPNSEQWEKFRKSFYEQAKDELYPVNHYSNVENRDIALSQYLDHCFWLYFDPSHNEYCPAIPGYDEKAFAVEASSEFEP
ncbi:hypothetical protein BT63DRAFT_430531 [Microthyrium microscopicum]|uniref:F-box domain-containing protein n=1 Tax=Microthyrium microscopicum TaxID=703497 RepID=A0A6A6TUB9_9PEZI|nr:hypothetical protein BT63DRAFT_430531 [Microthyrium microscopicum]